MKISNNTLLKFKDYLNNGADLYTFSRYLNNQEYIYIEGNLIITKIVRNTQFLTKLEPIAFINYRFMTMDLETRTIYGIMIPYCVSIYDGKFIKSFYLDDHKSPEDMLDKALTFIIRPKFNQFKVFLHNFSNFDSTFLLKIISNLNL